MTARSADATRFDQTRRMTAAAASAERYFRLYWKHAVAPDADTLFNLLNAMHSLNDRLKKEKGRSFIDIEEFVALKALRNLFHHHEELVHEVKMIPAHALPPMTTDLLFLCLTSEALVRAALDQVKPKYKDQTMLAMRRTFQSYGAIININPCLFNVSVRMYERLKEANLTLDGEAYLKFHASYQAEEDAGHSHLVTGNIDCHAGNVEEVLAKVFS